MTTSTVSAVADLLRKRLGAQIMAVATAKPLELGHELSILFGIVDDCRGAGLAGQLVSPERSRWFHAHLSGLIEERGKSIPDIIRNFLIDEANLDERLVK
jgi:hypothetical protein